jgi:hypothetical protein
MWRKWVAYSAGVALAAILAMIGVSYGVFWYASRPTPWDARGLVATDGRFAVTVPQINRDGPVTGFRIGYTVTNTTDQDIVLSNVAIKTRRAKDEALDDPPVSLTLLTHDIPAHQTVRLYLAVDPISDGDEMVARMKTFHTETHGIVIFDHTGHRQLNLPPPEDNFSKPEVLADVPVGDAASRHR